MSPLKPPRPHPKRRRSFRDRRGSVWGREKAGPPPLTRTAAGFCFTQAPPQISPLPPAGPRGAEPCPDGLWLVTLCRCVVGRREREREETILPLRNRQAYATGAGGWRLNIFAASASGCAWRGHSRIHRAHAGARERASTDSPVAGEGEGQERRRAAHRSELLVRRLQAANGPRSS